MTPSVQGGLVEQIVNAVLYEGYILYPYRPSSVKNRQRWTFGGIYPQQYSRAQGGGDPCMLRTECLVQGDERTVLNVRVRFLHLIDRTMGELVTPVRQLPEGGEPTYRLVEVLRVGDRVFTPWQEAVERESSLLATELGNLVDAAQRQPIVFPAAREIEPVTSPSADIVGVLLRRQAAIEGTAEVTAQRLAAGLFKVKVTVENVSAPEVASDDGIADQGLFSASRESMARVRTANDLAGSRDAALMRALVSAHVILNVRNGAFVSLLDPPDLYGQAAADCSNVGVWPVLVGPAGSRDTLLASPIILYDYPEVAPESPGDLFDGTEIDEILTLRILAMTDAEKEEMRQTDDRARALLERTEHLEPEQLARLHSVMRSPHQVERRTP